MRRFEPRENVLPGGGIVGFWGKQGGLARGPGILHLEDLEDLSDLKDLEDLEDLKD